jgi:hypothetical protein
MWINSTPVTIMLGPNIGVLNTKNQLQKLIFLAGSHGCKASYAQSLSNFMATAADDLEIPLTCVNGLSDLFFVFYPSHYFI